MNTQEVKTEREITHLRICSDLHFEFHRRYVHELVAEYIPFRDTDKNTLLVLAGDITPIREQLNQLYSIVCSRFPAVLHVPGNHEHYGSDFKAWDYNEVTWKAQFPNLLLSGNKVTRFVFDKFDVIGTTLWTTCADNKEEENAAVARAPDFIYISDIDTKSIASLSRGLAYGVQNHLIQLHRANPNRPRIVVTHHLPSYVFCDKRFSYTKMDGLFASDYDHIFASDWKPHLWVFGHTHIPIRDYYHGTRILCNPAGYPNEQPIQLYDPELIVPISDFTYEQRPKSPDYHNTSQAGGTPSAAS